MARAPSRDERQLADKFLASTVGNETCLIIVPNATCVQGETLRHLRQAVKLGKVVRVIGKDALRWEPIGKPHRNSAVGNSKAIDLGIPQG